MHASVLLLVCAAYAAGFVGGWCKARVARLPPRGGRVTRGTTTTTTDAPIPTTDGSKLHGCLLPQAVWFGVLAAWQQLAAAVRGGGGASLDDATRRARWMGVATNVVIMLMAGFRLWCRDG